MSQVIFANIVLSMPSALLVCDPHDNLLEADRLKVVSSRAIMLWNSSFHFFNQQFTHYLCFGAQLNERRGKSGKP